MDFSILLIFFVFVNASGIQVLGDKEKYCFQFTWPGSIIDDVECEDDITCQPKNNCKTLGNIKIPCVPPVKLSESPPNLTDIWKKFQENKSNFDKETSEICLLQRGQSCIKYTYTFNNAITKATYMCGKMIRNNETAITEGCFSQQLGGYEVEACACQPNSFGNEMPCNSSTKRIFSTTLILSLLLLLNLIQH